MKLYRLLILVALFLLPIASVFAKGRVIIGEISSYECGDNCYLTIIDGKGKEHSGLCTAKQCEAWNENVQMPDSYIGRRVKITVGKGVQLNGNGDVMGPFDAFKKIQFIK